MASDGGEDPEPPGLEALSRLVGEIARLLPAQGPIGSFIHHNTLHAFEHLPFEEAVVRAGEQFGCEPFLSEDDYRREIAAGRVRPQDVQALLARELGEEAHGIIAGTVKRIDLRLALALHGIPEAREPALSWLMSETSVLTRFRTDLPPEARSAVTEVIGVAEGVGNEGERLVALWRACLDGVGRVEVAPAPACRFGRHRDLLLAACGLDTDGWIHPVLIRFLSSCLDQGLAQWTIPLRERGLHACFVGLYSVRPAALIGVWARRLPSLLAGERARGRSGLTSLKHSLDELGVPPAEHYSFLLDTALALRGWAGMVRQIEERPDRLPGHPINATLVDFLAVRLLAERAALTHAASEGMGFSGPLNSLRSFLAGQVPQVEAADSVGRAWALFHVAQLCCLDASIIERFSAPQVVQIESELAAFSATERRRVLHVAYERFLSHHLYDALAQSPPSTVPSVPLFQAIFCLDEREESFRRHLEETEPDAETFGTAGFFGVPMYYRGATDARPRPLCPVAIVPDHYVSERRDVGRMPPGQLHARRRPPGPLLGHNIYLGSHTVLRGAVFMPLVGVAAIVPLVLRVLFPWLGMRLGRLGRTFAPGPVTRLNLDREEVVPPAGRHTGFAVDEMVEIVWGVLEDIGIARRLAPLVLVVGHASTSLNNPHESAHDCGACGGGRGGPNARALAQMANDPRVRRRLASLGLRIPPSTWFLAAERNTSNNAVDFFDEDCLPPALKPVLDKMHDAIDTARQRESHERCRRFDDVPAWYPAFATLAHVESRAAALAEPRPEYGHASNAFCVIGRRSRTRGLFLDRRSFLVSYDPTGDSDGRILARTLGSVVPVVAGISLEYYFGRVDPAGYGCGTKLPHNVTSLLGVMDGAGSDLRTGLPWQMVEIHEPVRLTIVVESEPPVLARIVRENADLERLVRNRWIFMAALAPNASGLVEMTAGAFEPYQARYPVPTVRGTSSDWYRGKRGHLRIARIGLASREDPVA